MALALRPEELKMLERILLPLDGSPVAEAIFPQIRPLLRKSDADIVLVRAVPSATPVGAGPGPPSARPELRAEAENYLADRVKSLEDQGARARAVVGVGRAAEVILEAISAERATLVAMTTHGRTGLQRWVFGSVTEKILRASEIPVFLVRSFQPEVAIRKILVPIDESELSRAIVPPAAELARLFGSRVAVLHVLEHDLSVPVPALTHTVEAFAERGVRAEPLLGRRDPASQILEECRKQGADLIAMTTHGRSGVSRWMLGSVTEKVLRSATVPMLVVRGRAS